VDPEALERLGDALAEAAAGLAGRPNLRLRQPALAISAMARRERLSAQAFRQAKRGLVYSTLCQQRSLLAADGPLSVSLRAVQQVQNQPGFVRAGSPLLRVSDAPLRSALR